MSLFESLRERVAGKKGAINEESQYINVPKLDGNVPKTAKNYEMVDFLREHGKGEFGAILEAEKLETGADFEMYKMLILSSCYDRRNEEEYLLARTYYGIVDSYDKENLPVIKHYISEMDMDKMYADGNWDGKLYPINSFTSPVRVYDVSSSIVQPISSRMDSAIFRASENGGIVYEMAKNETLAGPVDSDNNSFRIKRTVVTYEDYLAITKDNKAYEVSENFGRAEVDGQVTFDIDN